MKTHCVCAIYHLKAIDQLIRIDIHSYEGGNHFERDFLVALNMYQLSNILGIPLNYSLVSSSLCIG